MKKILLLCPLLLVAACRPVAENPNTPRIDSGPPNVDGKIEALALKEEADAEKSYGPPDEELQPPEAILQKALESALTIENDGSRGFALRGIAVAYARASKLSEALQVSKQIGDPDQKG